LLLALNSSISFVQYAAGGDLLARIIKSGPLTEPRAADIVRQLLGALRYMHDKGVIHRDLKPDNVLYSAEAWPTPNRAYSFDLVTSSSNHSTRDAGQWTAVTCGLWRFQEAV
jgi:serine/threonine protein kinase